MIQRTRYARLHIALAFELLYSATLEGPLEVNRESIANDIEKVPRTFLISGLRVSSHSLSMSSFADTAAKRLPLTTFVRWISRNQHVSVVTRGESRGMRTVGWGYFIQWQFCPTWTLMGRYVWLRIAHPDDVALLLYHKNANGKEDNYTQLFIYHHNESVYSAWMSWI